MSEVPVPETQVSNDFELSLPFEVNDVMFDKIVVDTKRISAIGPGTTLEIMISFIGALWMTEWRKYGKKLLAGGIILIVIGVLGFQFLSVFFLIFTLFIADLSVIPLIMSVIGLGMIILYFVSKRKSIMVYTTGNENFKIEGDSKFVTQLYNAIMVQAMST